MPTCITVSSKFIAIGTLNGLTILFDHHDNLKLMVGTKEGIEYGRVYCLALSNDSESLSIGHASGNIVVWNTTNGKLIKTILNEPTDILGSRPTLPLIPSNEEIKSPIIHVDFFEGNKNQILACGLDGVINIHILNKMFMVTMVDTQGILNGTSGMGSILTVSALKPGIAPHPIDSFNLLACATFKRIVIISSKDKSNVIYHYKKPQNTSEGSLPYLSWRETIVYNKKVEKFKRLDPILAIGWDKTIVLIQIIQKNSFLNKESKELNVEFQKVALYQTDTMITSLNWIGTSALVFTNASDQLRIFDPYFVEEIDSYRIKYMDLVYHREFNKPNFPNNMIKTSDLSNKYKSSSSLSYHNSIYSFQGKIYILGTKSPFLVTLYGWSERISSLEKKGYWLEALALALEFYQGRARCAKGLPNDTKQASLKILSRIKHLLHDYAKTNLETKEVKEKNHYDIVATVCIDYCLNLERKDYIFNIVYPIFEQYEKQGILLEKLEPFIIGDKIVSLPPTIMQKMVRHYTEDNNMISRIEQIILHINIPSLDFHSVIKLCLKYYLSTTLFHLYVTSLDDFKTPLEYSINFLKNNSLEIEQKKSIGMKIILFLKYTFSSKIYPSKKKIIPSRLSLAIDEIFIYLLGNEKNSLVSLLLEIDVVEILNTLSIALDKISDTKWLNQWMDILYRLMVDISIPENLWNEKESTWPFKPFEVAYFYDFLAKYYSRGYLKIDNKTLLRFISYSTQCSNIETIKKREKNLLDVVQYYLSQINSPIIENQDFPFAFYQSGQFEDSYKFVNRVLLLADKIKFYKVCEFLLTIKRDFATVLRCHFLDSDLKAEIFEFISKLVNDSNDLNLNENEKEDIKMSVLTNINELIMLDSQETAKISMDIFKFDHMVVLNQIKNYMEQQYLYLNACIEYSKTDDNSKSISVEIAEFFLNILCVLHPENVQTWITENENLYRLDQAIEILKKYSITPSYCSLQERAGNLSEVLKIYLESSYQKLSQFYEQVQKSNLDQNENLNSIKDDITNSINNCISLCKRNQNFLEIQIMWFKIFDLPMISTTQVDKAINPLNNSSEPSNLFSKYTQEQLSFIKEFLDNLTSLVLENMIGVIELQIILEKILQDHYNSKIGNFKKIFQKLLENYSHEKNILGAASKIFYFDTYQNFDKLVQRKRSAFSKTSINFLSQGTK